MLFPHPRSSSPWSPMAGFEFLQCLLQYSIFRLPVPTPYSFPSFYVSCFVVTYLFIDLLCIFPVEL